MLLRSGFLLAAALLKVIPVQGQLAKHPWTQFPLPTSVYIQDEASGDDFAARVLQHTLSGLATLATLDRTDVPSVWIRTGSVDDRWRTRFLARTGVPTTNVSSDVVALVKLYANLGVVKGFVKCRWQQPGSVGQQSNFVVCPLGAVAAAGAYVAALQAEGISQLADATSISYSDLLNGTYTFNPDLLTVLRSDQPHSRDLSVASSTLVALDVTDGGFPESLARLNAGAAVFGYGADEHTFTDGASTVGAGIVPTDWASNLPSMSSGSQLNMEPFPALAPLVDDGSSYYVAFACTDHDNVQWTLNDFTTNPFWFASPHRGKIPFSWGLHASVMYQLAPDATAWFQSNVMPNEAFVNYADSYAYLDVIQSHGSTLLEAFVSGRQPYAHALGLHSAVVFMDNWTSTAAYDTFAAADPDIRALFPIQYSSYSQGQGALGRTSSATGSKPVLSGRISMWNLGRNDSEFGDPAHVATVLNSWASAGEDERSIEQRVAWVPIHAWSRWTAPADAQDIASNGQLGVYSAALYASRKLAANVKLVTLDDIAALLN